MKKIWISIAALLALAACDSQPKTYSGPQEIVKALADADISCRDLKIDDGASLGDAEHESLIQERGVCWVDDVRMTLNTFEGPADRDDWLAVGDLLGPTTYGPNWAATGESKEIVDRIAEALDGSVGDV